MGSKAVVSADRVRRVRRSESQWRSLVSAFERSGEARRAFCTRQGLALSTFDWWRKRVGGGAAVARPDRAALRPRSAPGFVELTAAPVARAAPRGPNQSGWALELELGNGLVLRLRQGELGC